MFAFKHRMGSFGRSTRYRQTEKEQRFNITAQRYIGSLLLVDIEIESLSRKHPLKQRF
jgi:hypothetical protein